MPGIIAFVGAKPDAVMAACAALRRRPFHSTHLHEDAGASVTIGVVSEVASIARDETTGTVAVVDGEIIGERGSTAVGAADELLRRYLSDRVELEAPEGWFAGAVWDPRSAALVLVTDRLGQRPLYIGGRGRELLVAGELKALLAAGLPRALDAVGWAQLLAYEMTLGDRTPLAGVRLVPPASTLELRLEGGERLRRRWRYRLEPAEEYDERELVEEVGRLTTRAVAARLDSDTALALSGGLDSRTMLATLLAGEETPLLVSYGAHGSEDLRLATAVAEAVGFPHRSFQLEGGYLARDAATTVWLAEGAIRCLHAHHLVLRRVRAAHGARSILIGFAGDPVFRAYATYPTEGGAKFAAGLHRILATCVSDELLGNILTPRFAAQLRGLALESLRPLVGEEEGDDASRVRQFIWNHSQRRKVLPGALLFEDDLVARDPLADGDLIDLCRRMPERLRRGGVLQRAYLASYPSLARFASPKDGVPPQLRTWRRQFAVAVVKSQRRLRVWTDDAIGFHWLPAHRGLGDYAHDLRTQSRSLLDVLLEPQTLARGQLNEEAVRKLVHELVRGRRRNTRPLGMLLTLELFQRQFIDGQWPTERRLAA